MKISATIGGDGGGAFGHVGHEKKKTILSFDLGLQQQ
jgi:hypothetical protein